MGASSCYLIIVREAVGHIRSIIYLRFSAFDKRTIPFKNLSETINTIVKIDEFNSALLKLKPSFITIQPQDFPC